MKCPYCSHEFPMTWTRYLRSGLGRHLCPSCGKKSKFGPSRQYRNRVLIPIVLLSSTLTLVLLFLLSGSWVAMLLSISISLVVCLSLDRYLEDKLRELRSLEEEKAVPQPD